MRPFLFPSGSRNKKYTVMRNVTKYMDKRLVDAWYYIGTVVFSVASALAVIFFALSFVTGCSKVPVIGEGESEVMLPLSIDVRADAGLTKAPVTGESVPTGRTLIVSAYRNAPGGTGSANYATALPFTHTSSTTWACASGYWPMDGTLDFLAYSLEDNSRVSGVTWGSNNSSSLTMTLANNSSNQDDLIVGGSTANTSSFSSITFRHAESLLTFKASAYADYDSVNNTGVTITDVRVVNANHSGTVACTRSENNVSFAWSSLGNASTVSLPSLTATHLTETMSPLAGTPGLIVPPQVQKNITVYYTMHLGKDGSGDPVDVSDSYTYEASGTWEPSTRYIYEIEFTGVQIVINLTLTPWDEVTHEIAVADVIPTFGGLRIASGPVKYTGSEWVMEDNWDVGSYNSAYGLTANSTYFNFLQLGELFEKAGYTTSDGDIDNVLDPFDGWRLPTRAEWCTVTTGESPGTMREGSTVNGNSGVKYVRVSLSGDYVNYSDGLLLFPDGFSITGSINTNSINNTSYVSYLSVSQLQEFLDQGCAFLPKAGYYFADYGGFWDISYGYNWSSTLYDSDIAYVLHFGGNTLSPSFYSSIYVNTFYAPIRLVRLIP